MLSFNKPTRIWRRSAKSRMEMFMAKTEVVPRPVWCHGGLRQ
jgi:hypothetical protein